MKTFLPAAKDLEKLPMRAIVAYAARSARRLSSELRGIVDDDILNDSLRLVDAVWTADAIGEVTSAAVTSAAYRVTEAYANSSSPMKSLEKFSVVFSLVQASLSAMRVLDSIADPTTMAHHMSRTAGAAERAVRACGNLEGRLSAADADAARRDYELLLSQYGQHDDIVIGDRVTCFRKSDADGFSNQ